MGILMILSGFVGFATFVGIAPFNFWLGISAPFVLWLIIYATVLYHDYMLFVFEQIRFNKLKKENKSGYEKLLKTREILIDFLSQAA